MADDVKKVIKVSVRWWDGYIEEFDATEVRQGAFLLYIKLTSGDNRQIPLMGMVRWFKINPESHSTFNKEV